MRCYPRLLNTSDKDHVTNEDVRKKILATIGKYDELDLGQETEIEGVRPISRSTGSTKTILHGTMQGKRRKCRQKKRCEDDSKEWKGMDFASSTRAAEDRTRWKGMVITSSVMHQQPLKVME